MKTTTFFGIIVAVILAGLVGSVGYLLYPEVNPITKQIEEAQEVEGALGGGMSNYLSTTTQTSTLIGDAGVDTAVLITLSGTLVSVIFTTTGTGFDLYNATTSNISLRTGQKATSSLLLASIPSSLAIGVYEYNVAFYDGLLLDSVSSTTIASTTITWR